MIIIPDVHGRSFWEKPVYDNIENEHVLFLGDYLDPYPQEMIFQEEAWAEFREVVAIKRKNPDKVTLLLGNHDLHYLLPEIGAGRYDRENAVRNGKFFLDNLALFDLTCSLESPGNKYLFSHAGILPGWILENERLLFTKPFTEIGERLNDLLHDNDHRQILLWALSDTSFTRGGHNIYGSPVWADVTDHNPDRFSLENTYQIFGHSWMEREIITPYWACLDCGHAFRFNPIDNVFTKL